MLTILIGLTSCLNETDDSNSGELQLPNNVATLSEQTVAMRSSREALESLQTTLPETTDFERFTVQLASCVIAVDEHIAAVEAGLSATDAVMAAMGLQSKIAGVLGSLKVYVGFISEDTALQSSIRSVESGIAAWLGKDFNNYFEVCSEHSRLQSMLAVVEAQTFSVDAIASDVEAGLRLGDASDLEDVIASVDASSEILAQLNQKMASLSGEVEQGYAEAFKKSNTKSDLKSLNAKAAAVLSETRTTLDELLSRIANCEAEIAALNERLTKIEADVAELLGLIQSVTFVSEYSTENAIAYYEMNKNNKVTDSNLPYYGKAQRTATGSMELNYFIRPAAASTALNANTAAVDVIGYYARTIATKSVSASDYIDFEVEKIVATDPVRGLITVTVKPNLHEAFYFKEIGAKCALSIKAGSTDIASNFVEILPMDHSAEVYVTGITLSRQSIEIDKGETASLAATVTPSDANYKTYSWSSSNDNVVTVSSSGVLTAVGVGEATVTATTHGVDEWGLPLTAECTVKVNEAFRLSGPPYVEVGYTADLVLDYPATAIVESKVWKSSDTSKATVDQNGKVTGVGHTYLLAEKDYGLVTISCTINGATTVSHSLKVVAVQPKAIRVNGLADDKNNVTIKVDEKLSLASTIFPENVDPSHFRLYYSSDQGLGWIDSATGMINERGNTMSPATAWVYIDVFNQYDVYYFAPGASLRRTVVVKVEPYYVQTMWFAQGTLTLAPGQTSMLSPDFTSDVEGKLPTYTNLKWTSSNPNIVSVNETTGEIETITEGTATITATTSNDWAVPSGHDPLSASCTIIVKKPTDPVFVGDYFYSDGTWSTQLNSSKVLRGVVCQTGAPAATDKHLPSTCINGYVISVDEITAKLDGDANVSADKFNTWAQNHGYYAIELGDGTWNGAKGTGAYGYSNTSAYSELTDQRAYDELGTSWSGSHYGGWDFYLTGGGLETYRRTYSLDTSKGSNWYVPSQKEMTFVSDEVLTKVNAALSAAGKTQITNKNYKTSSYNTYGNAVAVNPVAKSATQQGVNTEGTIRFFCAF